MKKEDNEIKKYLKNFEKLLTSKYIRGSHILNQKQLTVVKKEYTSVCSKK